MSETEFTAAGVHQSELTTAAAGTLRYTLSLPPGYDRRSAYPLVVALHYGFDRAAPFPPYYGRGVLEGLVEPALAPLKAIVLAPDSHGKSWTDPAIGAAVLELTDWALAHYPVDADKTLLTGFSLGGIGTWHLIGIAGGRFRAGAAVAAAPPHSAVAAYPVSVPLFVVHSDADEIFPIAKCTNAVEALRQRGARVHYESVAGITHFNVPGFTAALAGAAPWVERVWSREST